MAMLVQTSGRVEESISPRRTRVSSVLDPIDALLMFEFHEARADKDNNISPLLTVSFVLESSMESAGEETSTRGYVCHARRSQSLLQSPIHPRRATLHYNMVYRGSLR